MSAQGYPTQLTPQERFAKLWTGVQPRVAAYVRSILPDPHLADDILQEVAVTCIRKIEEFNPDGNFQAWCIGIARVQILRHRKAAQQYRLLNHPDILEALADVHGQLEGEWEGRTKVLRQCLNAVADRMKQMLELCYSKKQSHAAIAKYFKLQTDSVKVMLSRTRASLRKCIEKRQAHGAK